MKNQRMIHRAGFLWLGVLLLANSLRAAGDTTFRIVVLDKEQHSVVPNAVVTVLDQNNTPVEVTAGIGEYRVVVPEHYRLTCHVSAANYLPVRGMRLVRPASGVVQILLTRRPGPGDTQTVAFVAKDALTMQPLGARFRLTNTQTNKTFTPTVTTVAHPEFGTELTMQQRYLLKVSSEDYEEYTASILIKEKESEPVKPRVILLRPLVYEVSFTFRDGGGLQFINPDRLQIREGEQTVPVRLDGDVGYATLRVGKDYEIRAEKEGYELFEHFLKFRMPAAPIELTKSILMVKAAQPKAAASGIVEKTTNPAENEKTTKNVAGTGDRELNTLAVGEALRLSSVYFDQSSYILRPESYPQLDKLAGTLKGNPKLKIEIGGHTDNVGDARLNQYLSENRAKVISSYLINQGVPEKQLVWKGYGPTRPIVSNDTEENRAQNRRVELIVLEK